MVAVPSHVKADFVTWHVKTIRAIRQSALSPTERHVLHVLASFGDFITGERIRPSVDRIAHDTGYTSRTVFRALSTLESSGWVTRHHQPGRPSTYDITPQDHPTPDTHSGLPLTQCHPTPDTVSPNHINDHIRYHNNHQTTEAHVPPPQIIKNERISPPAAHVPIHHERASAAHTSAHTHEGAGGREAHARVKVQDDLAAGGELVFTPYEQEHRARMEAPRVEDDEMVTKTLVGDWDAACVPLKDSVVDGRPGVQWIVALWRRGLARYNRPMPSDMRLEAIGKLHMELAGDAPIGAHEGYVRRWCDDLAASSMSHGAVLSRIMDDMRGSMHVAVSIFEDEREEVLEAQQERERAVREAQEREEQDRRVREAIIRRMEQEAAEQLAETVARRKAREAADEAALAKKRADDAAFEAFKARFEGRAVKGEGRP